MKKAQRYILKDGKPIPVSFEEWAKWFDTADRVIERTMLDDGTIIGTWFISYDSYDSLWGDGTKPSLFETTVIGGELDGEMERYTTLSEAKAGHAEMVQRVKELRNGKKSKRRRAR